ncbi:amino acid ABC transporter permease [Segnochrobactraceae bacterium EtOH-i3]
MATALAMGLQQVRSWWGPWPRLQLGALMLSLSVLTLFGWVLVSNMHRLGLTPGFGFLSRPAGFEIGEAPIAFAAGDSYGRAILAGLLNTVRVAVLGCVLATLLGVSIGIARLSGNPLLGRLAQIYVEVVRNTPLLLQLFFWSATLHALPPPRQALSPIEGIYLSNRGLFVPAPGGAAADPRLWLVSLVAAGAVVWLLRRTRRRVPLALASGLVGIALLAPAFLLRLAGASFSLDLPMLRGFNITGGAALSPELAALLIGLTVNAAAGISEIVRAGILAVPGGQWEAARALGLSTPRIFRLVVLPQALRVILPLMTSSYLSLTKNSSLAVAIGFPDLVSVVNTTANQTGQALEAILMLLGTYLALSVTVSAVMNGHDRRRRLREERG